MLAFGVRDGISLIRLDRLVSDKIVAVNIEKVPFLELKVSVFIPG